MAKQGVRISELKHDSAINAGKPADELPVEIQIYFACSAADETGLHDSLQPRTVATAQAVTTAM